MEKFRIRTLILNAAYIIISLFGCMILLLSGVGIYDGESDAHILRLFIDLENCYLGTFGFLSLISSLASSVFAIAIYKKIQYYKISVILYSISSGLHLFTAILYSLLFVTTSGGKFELNIFAIIYLTFIFIAVLINSFLTYLKINEHEKYLESLYADDENSVFTPFNID